MSKRNKIALLISGSVLVIAVFLAYRWYHQPTGLYRQNNSGLYPLKQQNGEYGYIDKTGKMVIPPQFEAADDFSEGLAAVKLGSRTGYIDTNGKMVIPPQWSLSTGTFRYGRAAVQLCCIGVSGQPFNPNEQRWGLIDTSGKLIATPEFTSVGPFADDRFNPLAQASTGGKTGFIDRSGKFVIPATFDTALPFNEGFAAAAVGSKWGFIDRSGSWVIQPQFDRATSFINGLAPVMISGKWGFIDTAGKFVINPHYEAVTHFDDGHAAVNTGGKWIFIDTNDASSGETPYTYVGDSAQEGMRLVKTDEGWGYVQGTKLVIAPIYDTTPNFLGGLAHVWLGFVDTYIDKKGNYIGDAFKGHDIQPAQPVQEIWQGSETVAKSTAQLNFLLIRQGTKISGYYMEPQLDTSQLSNRIDITGDVGQDGSVNLTSNNGLKWKGRFAVPVIIAGTMPYPDGSTPEPPFKIHFVRNALASDLPQPQPPTTSSWPLFLDTFKTAFAAHDEAKLGTLVGSNFYLQNAMIHNLGDIFRQLNWPQITKAITDGTIGDIKSPLDRQRKYIEDAHPCDNCVYSVELTFEQDGNGQWRWTGVVYPGD